MLGASGDSPMYDKYLSELGAADASDAILAVAAYCPITDLENADRVYEFVFGGLAVNGQVVDETVSRELLEHVAAPVIAGLAGPPTARR